MKTVLHNKKILKDNRKELRNNLTPAEGALWKYLQKSQLNGIKFRRQHSVGNYILDFYCSSERLAIELDGEGHYTEVGIERDILRDAFLIKNNIKVLRFENKMIFESLEWVLEEIQIHFKPPLTPP